ncbi:MAG: hypothetical protein JWN62_826 [Acidimicrobiales bacterium]|nr:hypothetical protein [Acidimicrobiales bacterium]
MSTAERLKEEPEPIADPREAVLNKRPTSTGSASKRATKNSNGSRGSDGVRKNGTNGNGTNGNGTNGNGNGSSGNGSNGNGARGEGTTPATSGQSAAPSTTDSGSSGNGSVAHVAGDNGASGNRASGNGSSDKTSSRNGSSRNGSRRNASDGNGSGTSAANGNKPASAKEGASNGSPPPAAPSVVSPAALAVDDIDADVPTVSIEPVTLYDVEREKPVKVKRSLRDFVAAKLLPAEPKPSEPQQPSDAPLFDEPSAFEHVPGRSAPITGPVEVIPVTPPVAAMPTSPPGAELPTARSPFVGMPIVEPDHGPPVGSPVRIDPGLLPEPSMLVPAIAPRVVPLPAVFDDEPTSSGLSFGDLFDPVDGVELDPELDLDDDRLPAAHAIRSRTLQFAQRGRRGRPRVRRVTRVVRHVDPWSVFKVALCFSLVLYGVCLTAGVLLWNVAYTTGTIDNVQRFFESFGWDTFRFKGGELFHNAWIAGLFAALGLTGLIVLTATLFNLITDLVGGIRITVLEEEVVERAPVVRGPLLRRRKGMLVGPLLGPRPGQPDATVAESENSDDPFG